MFRMCLHFRVEHPRRLAGRFTREELADWWAYYQVDPWGEKRADYRAFVAARSAYCDDAIPEWPYIEPAFTADDLRDAMRHG